MNFIQILIYDYGISTMKNIKTLVFLPIPIYHIYYSWEKRQDLFPICTTEHGLIWSCHYEATKIWLTK